MSDLIIKYESDSLEGNSLGTILRTEDTGWVEYCNRQGQLYHATGLSQDLYNIWHADAVNTIASNFENIIKKNVGFLNHLAQVAINEPFMLPLFGIVDPASEYPDLNVGKTRFAAGIMNGYQADDYQMIMFVKEGQQVKNLKNLKELNTTDDFVKLFKMRNVDYEISMTDSAAGDKSAFRFDRSVLRHSIYDKNDQALPHTATGANTINFWSRNISREKIAINVRCTKEVEKLIKPTKIFDARVVHEDPTEWEWSYGRILGAYRESEEPTSHFDTTFNLWLYDVTEPVHLELLIPWANGQHTSFHTKNKKAIFFDTERVTSMQVIGDWVK